MRATVDPPIMIPRLRTHSRGYNKRSKVSLILPLTTDFSVFFRGGSPAAPSGNCSHGGGLYQEHLFRRWRLVGIREADARGRIVRLEGIEAPEYRQEQCLFATLSLLFGSQIGSGAEASTPCGQTLRQGPAETCFPGGCRDPNRKLRNP